MSRGANRRDRDRRWRNSLREKLAAKGIPADRIERIIAEAQIEGVARRHAQKLRDQADTEPQPPTREEILANTDDSLWPDDTGYKPNPVDPLLHGAARVSGVTAKVVRGKETITEWQYDRRIERDR